MRPRYATPMKTSSAAPASVRVRRCKQRTKALVSALLGREISYDEAMKVKRALVSLGVLPRIGRPWPRRARIEPLRAQSFRSKAREAGLPAHVLWNRIFHLGWSEEEATLTPVGARIRDSLAAKARAAGLPPDMVRRRVREGWSEKRALSTPPLC